MGLHEVNAISERGRRGGEGERGTTKQTLHLYTYKKTAYLVLKNKEGSSW